MTFSMSEGYKTHHCCLKVLQVFAFGANQQKPGQEGPHRDPNTRSQDSYGDLGDTSRAQLLLSFCSFTLSGEVPCSLAPHLTGAMSGVTSTFQEEALLDVARKLPLTLISGLCHVNLPSHESGKMKVLSCALCFLK